jgi:GT2 family glycosyltransferase
MKSTSEPVSIVLLFYHRTGDKMPDNYDPDMMKDCVDSIIQHTKDYQLIAVDNGSTTDESWIKEHTDRYIRFEKNMGISNGWNSGILAAKHDKVIILGDDTVVSEGWTEAMLECFKHEDCGASCPQVEGMPYRDKLQEVWSWFPGACFMLSKERTVKKVGYFDWDTFFPCNWEDASYWVRLMAHGLKLYTNPSAFVQHRMGATLHVDDLSSPFEQLRHKFIKKHGFDCQPYLYGDQDIKTKLHLVDKTVTKPNPELVL